MANKILVSDTLFIFDSHVKALEDAGYKVIRVEKPDMSEDEIIAALDGIEGYILGGIEYVTDRVFEACKELRAIVYTGTGYKGHIPGYKTALNGGVLIGNTPYANVYEVSEWAVAVTLAMQRQLFLLGPDGDEKFKTVESLPNLSIGVLGLGHIGRKFADMMSGLGAKKVNYWSRQEKDSPYTFVDKKSLFNKSDVVFVAVSDDAGKDFVSSAELGSMKTDALLVSISHHGIVDEKCLAGFIESGKIRAGMDIVHDRELFTGFANDRWYASNSSAAYNSTNFLQRASDMAVSTIINLLTTGSDINQID